VSAAELDELSGLGDDGAALGRPGDVDPPAATELQQTLIAEHPERSQDRVGVDLEDGGEIACRRQPFSGGRLTLGDRTADLARDLFVQNHGSVAVDVDFEHRASDTSFMFGVIERSWAPPRWAVIKDARRRQRRRRRRMLAGGAGLLLAAALGWLVAGNAQSPPPTPSPDPAVGAVVQLQLGGIVVDTTTLRGDVWVLTCLRRCSGPPSTASAGQLIKLGADGRPIKRIAVADPTVLTAGDGALWIAHAATDEVTRINPRTGRRIATIRLELRKPVDTSGDRRFIPGGIGFGAGHVWVSSWRGWTAAISAHTPRPSRMIWSSSQVTSTTTAAGLTWIADELDGVGTVASNSSRVVIHQIAYPADSSTAGDPVDVATVAYGAGRIWALGSASADTSTDPFRSLDIVTAIDARTGQVIRQWRIPGANSIVFLHGSAYIGQSGRGQVTRLVGSRPRQILRLPQRALMLTSATAHALWATTRNGRLLRIDLTRT
jgi:hypothetical protein